MDDRDDIHGDIEKIRQVLQTDEGEFDLGAGGDGASSIRPPIHDLDTPGSSAQHSHQFETDYPPLQIDEDGEQLLEGDELPATPAIALALNRAYQELIEENLKRIKLVLNHNRERQIQIEEEIESSALEKEGKKKKVCLTIYGIPYFKDVTGLCPPPNEDAILKRVNQEVDPHVRSSKPWTTSETKILRQAMIDDCRKKLMSPILSKRELVCEKLMKLATDDENPELQQERESLEQELEFLRKLDLPDLLVAVTGVKGEDHAVQDIDWMKISTVDFNGQRSGDELRLNWIHFVHPKVNTSKFRPDEDIQLAVLAQHHGFRNWSKIAHDLNTNRTAFQCLQRYQMKLNPCLKTGKWTSEEDDILREVVDQCRMQNGEIDWSNVSFFMEGRSFDHCQQRWKEVNAEMNRRRGKWSEEEDMKLLMAVQMFGTQWYKVTKFVPGRSNLQVRERWYTAFQNSKKGDWTYDEDKTIWLHVQKHGPTKWAALARSLRHRSDNAVLLRYKRLEKWSHVTGDSMTRFAKVKAKVHRVEFGCKDNQKRERNKKEAGEFKEKTIMLPETGKKARKAGSLKSGQSVDEVLNKHEETCGRSLREKDECWSSMEQDIRTGLIIPRPPPDVENTRISRRMVNQRLTMQQKLQEQIEKSLVRKSEAKGLHLNRSALEQQVTNILGGKNTADMSAMDRFRLDAVGKMLTVKEILDLSTTIQNKVSRSKEVITRSRGRPKDSSRRADQTDAKIWKLVAGSRVVDAIKREEGRNAHSATDDLDIRVSKLMSAALNVDLPQCVERATNLSEGDVPAAWKVNEATEGHQQALQSSLNRLSQVTGTEFPPVNLDSQTTDSEATGQKTGSPNNRGRRKKFKDNQATVYNIPPLPPNRVTVQAFRSLLLHRKELVDIAGKYHIPGSLTLGKNPGDQLSEVENSQENLSAYRVMRAEKNKNEKLQSQTETHQFEGYVGRNLQNELQMGDSILLLPAPLVMRDKSARQSSAPTEDPSECEATPQPSTSHENMQEADQVDYQVADKDEQIHSESPSFITTLEDVLEPIADFNQESEHVSRIRPEHIDPSIHRRELGRYLAGDLLLAKSVVREKEVNAIKTGKMTQERFEHHLMAVQNSVDVTQAKQNPEERKKPRVLETLRGYHDYQLLNSRFQSLFLWPALLSTIQVRKPLPVVKPAFLKKPDPVVPEPTNLPRATFPGTPIVIAPISESEMTARDSKEQKKVRMRRRLKKEKVEKPKRPKRKRGLSADDPNRSRVKRVTRGPLSAAEKEEYQRILQEVQDEQNCVQQASDANVIEEAAGLVALLQQRMQSLHGNQHKDGERDGVYLAGFHGNQESVEMREDADLLDSNGNRSRVETRDGDLTGVHGNHPTVAATVQIDSIGFHGNQQRNEDSANQTDQKEHVACIMIGEKLFPLSHELFRDFVVNVMQNTPQES